MKYVCNFDNDNHFSCTVDNCQLQNRLQNEYQINSTNFTGNFKFSSLKYGALFEVATL